MRQWPGKSSKVAIRKKFHHKCDLIFSTNEKAQKVTLMINGLACSSPLATANNATYLTQTGRINKCSLNRKFSPS